MIIVAYSFGSSFIYLLAIVPMNRGKAENRNFKESRLYNTFFMRKIFLTTVFTIGVLISYAENFGIIIPHANILNQTHLKGKAPGKLIDIFSSMDTNILKCQDESVVSNYLIQKNQEIIEYIGLNYESFAPYLDSVDLASPDATLFGLVCAIYEANDFEPIDTSNSGGQNFTQLPAWFNCTMSVIGVVAGIDQVFATLGTFSFGSAWTLVKFIVRKYVFGWFGLAYAVYSVIHECF